MEKDRIKVTLARKPAELKQIIELQKANLIGTVSESEMQEQGFVTAVHTLPLLQRMNDEAAAVIAKRGREVVAYALAMPLSFRDDLPVLRELIERQDALLIDGKLLGEVPYLIVGQVCVGASARGQKLADRMYRYMRTCYYQRYAYLVTGIDARNTRSLRVHERVGFKQMDRFHSSDGKNWVIVVWDWRKGMPGQDDPHWGVG